MIEVKNINVVLGGQPILKDLSLAVNQGEIIAIAGGSGSGKTTLLRAILMLVRPTSGNIHVFDVDLLHCSLAAALTVQHRWGVLFQHGALFSSLTVLENVMFPLRTFTELETTLQQEIAYLKIALAGLPSTAATKYPAELSGGMIKRAALARAIALDPELLFFDEPTSGLDPKSAAAFDDLILELRDSLGLTVVMVTHDLDSMWRVCDRVAFLGDGKVLAISPMKELVNNPDTKIKEYFSVIRQRKVSE